MKKRLLLFVFAFISLYSVCNAQDVIYSKNVKFVVNKDNAFYAFTTPDGPVDYSWTEISGKFVLRQEKSSSVNVYPTAVGDIEFRYDAVFKDGRTLTIFISGRAEKGTGSGGGTGGEDPFKPNN